MRLYYTNEYCLILFSQFSSYVLECHIIVKYVQVSVFTLIEYLDDMLQ